MSINLYNSQIDKMFLHKVGNKARNEEMILSDQIHLPGIKTQKLHYGMY
mgnify:CR=1 FL=1